uniref:Thioredoxin domain-containing protein n=1 Tax=Arion vulgaris TaxID=1028688 RepID=A0A0B7AXF3_9EUPU
MAHTLESLLGETVTRASGQSVSVRSLCGKERVLGLYFSANWSPPCRMFMPTLASFYESLKDGSMVSKDNLEIIQISWDKDIEGYKESTQSTPWLSLPWEQRDKQRKLSRKFGVHGIPRLVLLDGETGRVITRDGFDRLSEDSTGSGFPWRRKPLHDVLKGTLLQAVAGSEILQEIDANSAVDGQSVLGFYFSAHWCLPCRYFDPEIVRAYQTLRSRGEKFQVIFVSADRSEEAFQRHVAGMPWLTIPYEDSRNQAVKKHLGVDGIPMLVLVDEKGTIITMNGRQAITQDPECKDYPWHPQPIEELAPLSSVQLNENICAIYFSDGTEAGLKQGMDVLSTAASREAEKGEERDIFFFIAGEDDFSDNVRDFADLDDTCPLLVILDSPEHNVYTCSEVKVTSNIALEFVDKFFRGELTPTPIPPLCADLTVSEASAVL